MWTVAPLFTTSLFVDGGFLLTDAVASDLGPFWGEISDHKRHLLVPHLNFRNSDVALSISG
jgi:hypothetical protein